MDQDRTTLRRNVRFYVRHVVKLLLIAAGTAVLGVIGLIVMWVASAPPNENRSPAGRAAELAERPSTEAMIARYDEMHGRIRDRIDAEIGPFAWRQVGEQETRRCRYDFPDLGGQVVHMQSWVSSGSLTDDDRATAEEIGEGVSAEYGFDGDTRDGFGAAFTLVSDDRVSMGVTTGCHLATR